MYFDASDAKLTKDDVEQGLFDKLVSLHLTRVKWRLTGSDSISQKPFQVLLSATVAGTRDRPGRIVASGP
jgi:hypothetical protein